MTKALVAEGRCRLRARRASAQTIGPEQIETFLVTLGQTCNVVHAARAGGFTASWAYRLRQRDASFRTGWAQAVREGYAKLELVLLERAMKGTARPIQRRDGSERIIREYSTQLAVALLRRHAETADSASYEPGEDEMRELRDKILAKLERVRERDERALRDAASTGSPVLRGAAPGNAYSDSPQDERDSVIETKGMDRIGLILWGLRRA